MATRTWIKRIHNRLLSNASVINRETHPDLTEDIPAHASRAVDWAIPWAWENEHFVRDERHIDVVAPGVTCSIWQQDDNVFATSDGTFTGTRTRLGGIGGERQLVILPTGCQLIGMLDPIPIPVATPNCLPFGAPYTAGASGSNISATPAGGFSIDIGGWFVRADGADAWFEKDVTLPPGTGPAEVQATFGMAFDMRAEGLGYARSRIVLRLEVRALTPATAPSLVNEQRLIDLSIPFIGLLGAVRNVEPVLTVTINPAPATTYRVRATVIATAGGGGFIQVQCKTWGRMLGLQVCRI